jgi:hypothetical protein
LKKRNSPKGSGGGGRLFMKNSEIKNKNFVTLSLLKGA